MVQLRGIAKAPTGEICIVTELCDGKSIQYMINHGIKISAPDIKKIAKGVAAGIA